MGNAHGAALGRAAGLAERRRRRSVRQAEFMRCFRDTGDRDQATKFAAVSRWTVDIWMRDPTFRSEVEDVVQKLKAEVMPMVVSRMRRTSNEHAFAKLADALLRHLAREEDRLAHLSAPPEGATLGQLAEQIAFQKNALRNFVPDGPSNGGMKHAGNGSAPPAAAGNGAAH